MRQVRAAYGHMDRTELAWAAGFWDGEGWTNRVRSGRGDALRPMAQINQSDQDGVPDVLLRFQHVVGCGRIAGPEINARREPLYQWVASSEGDVRRVATKIGGRVGDVKRKQFESALDAVVPRLEWDKFPDVERRAWAAGLWDGEGCLCLLKHRSHAGHFVPEAAVTQSSETGRPEVLSRFADVAGSGYWYGPFHQVDSRLPVYRWKLFREDEIKALLELIWPWLGPTKRSQAMRVLLTLTTQPELAHGNPAWGSHKTHCIRGHEYASARVRPFRSRGKHAEPQRASHQCLVCCRENARAKRAEKRKDSDSSRCSS